MFTIKKLSTGLCLFYIVGRLFYENEPNNINNSKVSVK